MIVDNENWIKYDKIECIMHIEWKRLERSSKVNRNTIEIHAKMNENISQSFCREDQVFNVSNGSILLPNWHAWWSQSLNLPMST